MTMPGVGAYGAFAGAAVGTLALVLNAVLSRIVRAQTRRLAERDATIEEMRRRLDAMTAVQTRVATRLQRLEGEQSRLAERIVVAESGGGRHLDEAIESARRGASADVLAETFGLSRGEASLIARLHGRLDD